MSYRRGRCQCLAHEVSGWLPLETGCWALRSLGLTHQGCPAEQGLLPAHTTVGQNGGSMKASCHLGRMPDTACLHRHITRPPKSSVNPQEKPPPSSPTTQVVLVSISPAKQARGLCQASSIQNASSLWGGEVGRGRSRPSAAAPELFPTITRAQACEEHLQSSTGRERLCKAQEWAKTPHLLSLL